MRSVFICTALVICVSSEQPFVRFSENLNKVVPDHYKYDKENPHRSVDKVARGHKVEPRQPPLKPQPAVPWFKWVHEGRWAAQADRNSELHKVRARLLEQKLKPNQFAFRPHINPQIKPKLKPVGGNRVKRETESIEVKKEPDVKIRRKRDATISQVQPEIMKPQQEAAMLTDQLGRIVKDSEKRDKRHILYFINRPPQLMARIPRTTPNPFIRDTHIEEYDIIRPEVGEREGMIPTIETGSSDPGSYPLVSETSDLEYESEYTISMSDSEDWHNYPLTTPSGPNPGWQLSTLADIYQKQGKTQKQVLKPEKIGGIKTILRVWPLDGNNPHVRAKRSPKQRKRKIGAYKEKIKQRRKLKDIRRMRRIIRNSKEDKAVKEYLKDEKAVEGLLQKPRVVLRQMAYQEEDKSREILWSNGTHNIVEDKDAAVKWINETHYIIYKEQDNSTDEWYHKHHVLLFNDEWENKTSEEKRKMVIGAQEEESEEVTAKEKTKSGKAVVKKKLVKRKGRKGALDKKAPKPKIKSKKSRKIMTAKNVNIEPKDPRRDPREKKIVQDSSSSEEEKVKKKQKKVKTDIEDDSSKSKEKKKKKVKKDDKSEEKKKKKVKKDDKSEEKKKKKVKKVDEKDYNKSKEKKKAKNVKEDSMEDEFNKNKRRRKSKIESDEEDVTGKKIKKKSKLKDSTEKNTDKTDKLDKEKKTEKEAKKSPVEIGKSSGDDGKKKKKYKKNKDTGIEKKDKNETRRKRSIYRSDESNRVKVRWEKVQKSEYDDGWQVFGEDDKSEVYDVSYELIETKNITKKH